MITIKEICKTARKNNLVLLKSYLKEMMRFAAGERDHRRYYSDIDAMYIDYAVCIRRYIVGIANDGITYSVTLPLDKVIAAQLKNIAEEKLNQKQSITHG